MKIFKRSVISSAMMGSLVLLAACGGGSQQEPEKSTPAATAPTAIADVPAQYSKMLKLVEDQKIGRQAYSLTASLGKYGSTLREAGWEFSAVSDLSSIPNAAKTLVYVNASDASINSEALAKFMAGFQGVVIVDSDWVKTQEDRRVDPESLSAGATVADSSATTPEASAATLLHGKLFPRALASPNGTALVQSMRENIILPLSFDQEGLINGFEAQKFTDNINLQITAASNYAASIATDGREHAKFSDETADAKVAWYGIKDGWIAAFQFKAWGYKNTDGKHYVLAEVWSGDNQNVCLVQNIYRCGVYPSNNAALVQTRVIDSSTVETISYATSYYAQVNTFSANTIDEYGPNKAAWTSSELVNTDTTERKWSEGFSLGVSNSFSSAGAGIFGLNAAYTRAKLYARRYYSWNGTSSHYYHPTAGNGTAMFYSGIDMVEGRNIVDTSFYSLAGNFVTDFRKQIIAGEPNRCGSMKNSNYVKPNNAWAGWNPSTTGIVQVKPDTPIWVNGGTGWGRAKNYWKRSGQYWTETASATAQAGDCGWTKRRNNQGYWVGADILLNKAWFTHSQ